MGVSERGLHAWKHQPPSHRQRRDMVLLAHIRDQHRLSLGSYGRPRMTVELNELGLRVGRLMRQNGIQVIRSRKFKRTRLDGTRWCWHTASHKHKLLLKFLLDAGG